MTFLHSGNSIRELKHRPCREMSSSAFQRGPVTIWMNPPSDHMHDTQKYVYIHMCLHTLSSMYELSTRMCTYMLLQAQEHIYRKWPAEISLTNRTNHRWLENSLTSMSCHKDNCKISSILREYSRHDL